MYILVISSSPMLFRHSMSITQQLMPIYNTTVHKNKINVALNLMWLTVGCYETPTGHKGGPKLLVSMKHKQATGAYIDKVWITSDNTKLVVIDSI